MYVLSVYVHNHLDVLCAKRMRMHILRRYGCLERSTRRGHEQPTSHKPVGLTDPSRDCIQYCFHRRGCEPGWQPRGPTIGMSLAGHNGTNMAGIIPTPESTLAAMSLLQYSYQRYRIVLKA